MVWKTTTVNEEHHELVYETGISNGNVVIRLNDDKGELLSKLTFEPEAARELAKKIIAQADMADSFKKDELNAEQSTNTTQDS